VAKDLDTICMKCLEKIPARRYGTASEVAGDLERYIAGEAILARPPGLRSRLTRKMARNKAVSVTLAAALAVLVCAGIVGAVLLSQGTKRIEEEKDRADRAEARESENAKVARVLLMAYSRLGDVHKELKRSIWDTSRPLQAKRELYRKYEGRIRDFQERVEKDPLSQATMLSVHGWLLRLGGFDEEAFEAFEKARATAPEVAPGYLFEAMVWLSQYLAGQPLPMFVTGKAGIEFEAVPAETPLMRKARLQFEAILDDLGKDALSGDETEAFGRILDGFRALHGTGSSSPADLETAEEGLTLALSQSTMGWLEAEILLARLKVRYLLKDFEGGLKDAERYLELCPGLGEAHSFLGLLQKGMGISAQLEGGDSRPWFEKATRSFSAALDARRDPSFGHASRGSALAGLARAEADRGLDPRENYRKAIEDFSRALDARPEYEMARNNRANALVALGREEEARGADPREHFRRAVRDLDGVLRRKPGFYLARNNRSIALMELGGAESKFGSDPRDHYRRAVEDATEAIRGDPDSPDAHTNRGNAYLALGRAQWAFGSDPGPLYGKALEDHGRALEMDPEFRPAYLNRGIVRIRFGEAEADRGRDPRTHYGKAVEDFGEVLKRNPRDSWALYQRGRAREALARWEEGRGDDPRDSYRCSLADFDDAVRLNPLSASIRFDRGLLHKSLGDQGASRGSEPIPEFLLALRDFDEALRLNPEKAAAYRERGIVHLRVAERKASRKQDAEREFQNALRDLDEAERRKPGNVLAISCRASARLGLGDVEMERNGDAPRFYLEAVADLDETLRLEPGHVNARNNRGNARFKLGDLDLMAGRDPIGQYEKALEDYSEAARRRSSHWQSRANKGLVLKRMGRYGEAAEILEEARRMAGGRHRGLQGWLDHARETEALPEWRRKLVLAADHLKRGGWASARALYEEGLRKGKEDSDAPEPVLRKAHYSLAQILAFTSTGKRARLAEVEPLPEAERSAQEVGALAHLRRALELGWNNIPYTRKDPNFEPIRERPEFEALLAEWEKRSKGK
jgi:tetratricopeptide (TPR) repeat protein